MRPAARMPPEKEDEAAEVERIFPPVIVSPLEV